MAKSPRGCLWRLCLQWQTGCSYRYWICLVSCCWSGLVQDPLKASDKPLTECGPYILDEEDAEVYRRPYLTSGSSGFALTALSRVMKSELKVCAPFFGISLERSEGQIWHHGRVFCWLLFKPELFSVVQSDQFSSSVTFLCEGFSCWVIKGVITINWMLQGSVSALRKALTSDRWTKPISIVWGLKDRWLDFKGVEDFSKQSKARLVQLSEVDLLLLSRRDSNVLHMSLVTRNKPVLESVGWSSCTRGLWRRSWRNNQVPAQKNRSNLR